MLGSWSGNKLKLIDSELLSIAQSLIEIYSIVDTVLLL